MHHARGLYYKSTIKTKIGKPSVSSQQANHVDHQVEAKQDIKYGEYH